MYYYPTHKKQTPTEHAVGARSAAGLEDKSIWQRGNKPMCSTSYSAIEVDLPMTAVSTRKDLVAR